MKISEKNDVNAIFYTLYKQDYRSPIWYIIYNRLKCNLYTFLSYQKINKINNFIR